MQKLQCRSFIITINITMLVSFSKKENAKLLIILNCLQGHSTSQDDKIILGKCKNPVNSNLCNSILNFYSRKILISFQFETT